MKTIAVIGLGIMGHGIADNFIKHNYKVIVWNRTPQKAQDLVSKGAILAKTVKEAVKEADLVFEVTANDESSKQVWLEDGIIDNAKPNACLITCATLSVKWTDELANKCLVKNLTFFDMPMTGGRQGAESGQLILLIGGDEVKLKTIEPDLKTIAIQLKYFGKAGSGMRYKLTLNSLQAMHIAALSEALKMAKTSGLDEKLAGNALAERPGGTTTNLAWRDFQNDPKPINFSVEWIAKDLGYASEMSQVKDLPLLEITKKLYKQAIDEGYAQSDWTKIKDL